MDDVEVLTERNEQFGEACRNGSWEMVKTIVSPAFAYLDGATGEVWGMDRYIEDLRENPSPTVRFDQLAIHVDGNIAAVSARSLRLPSSSNRYLDTYERRNGEWLCIHSCVWPLDTRLP